MPLAIRARHLTALSACLALASLLPSPSLSQTATERFQFALIGDAPYTRVQEVEYQRLLTSLNRNDLAFVVHIGDFQFDARPYNDNPSVAAMPCVDETYKAVFDSFQTVRHPFVMTPGDNDWTDCWPLKAQPADPLQLLAKIRTMFYPEGKSLGQRTMPVKNQSSDPQFAKFRENLRWTIGGVTFATIHTVGSNDNLGRTPEMDIEHMERKAANIAWLKQTFADAKADSSRGLVIMTQANPGFENFWPATPSRRYFTNFIGAQRPNPPRPTGFDDLIKTLQDEMESYNRPTLYLHGDLHLFKIDKPLYSKKTDRSFENFTRVETFGEPDTHWVRITVDPADPQLFVIRPEIIPENVANHR